MVALTLPRARDHHRGLTLTTADPFDRRAIPSPVHEKDLQRSRAGSPRPPSNFPMDRKEECRGTFRSVHAITEMMTPLTRRCSFASVIDSKRKSRNRCFRPRSTRNWTLAGNAANTIVVRAARSKPVKAHPLPAVIRVLAAFPFFGRTNRRRCREASAHDTSRHHAMGSANVETLAEPATITIT